jgi:hypothetical protein
MHKYFNVATHPKQIPNKQKSQVVSGAEKKNCSYISYKRRLLFFPTLILLSGVGTTYFSSCRDKDSKIIFTTSRLPDVNPP